MVEYKSREDVIAEVRKRSKKGYICRLDFDADLYRAFQHFFSNMKLVTFAYKIDLKYRSISRDELVFGFRKLWLEKKGDEPITLKGILEVAPHLRGMIFSNYFGSAKWLSKAVGLPYIALDEIKKDRCHQQQLPLKKHEENFKRKGTGDFKKLCKIVIEAFKDRKSMKFTPKDFRVALLSSKVIFKRNISDLLVMLKHGKIIEQVKRGTWKLTDEAVKRYNREEFHDKG